MPQLTCSLGKGEQSDLNPSWLGFMVQWIHKQKQKKVAIERWRF
jgi:hypothetical protein